MADNKNTTSGIVPPYDIRNGNPNDFCCLNDDGTDPSVLGLTRSDVDDVISAITGQTAPVINISGATITSTDIEYREVCIESSGGTVTRKLQKIEQTGGGLTILYCELDALTLYNVTGDLASGDSVVPCSQTSAVVSVQSQPC